MPDEREDFCRLPRTTERPVPGAGMNPVPTLPRGNDGFAVQRDWNGVNIPNIPEGQRPKAIDVSPWFGVYLNEDEDDVTRKKFGGCRSRNNRAGK